MKSTCDDNSGIVWTVKTNHPGRAGQFCTVRSAGHDAVPQLDPGRHPLRGRVRPHPAAGARQVTPLRFSPASFSLKTLPNFLTVEGRRLLRTLRSTSARRARTTTAPCSGRSRRKVSTTSSWTLTPPTSQPSSGSCCSFR